jgi:hypothetical protein
MGEDDMKVTVDIPDRDYWRIATVAEQRGIRVGEIVSAAAASIANVAVKPCDVVKGLVLAGFPDGEISKRTGMTVLAIATHRRALGLPPNRRAEWETKQKAADLAARRKEAA